MATTKRSHIPFTRRKFLRGMASFAGVAAVGSSGIGLSSLRAAVPVAYASWTLKASATQEAFGDGATVDFFRYQAHLGSESRGNLPYFEAAEGSLVVITVFNDLPILIRPQIPGVALGPNIAPGTTGWFHFTMPAAGTYLLGQARLSMLSGPIGFAGVMVSRPANGAQELWSGGPAFDREYVLHYQDSDKRWNDDVAQLTLPNSAVYEPNYFTVNGLSYPDTTTDADTFLACQSGERMLLRLSNSGRMRQSIHFHGYHVETAARDNVPNTMLPAKDTVEVASGSTTDVILTVNQTGVFPVHPHSLTAVTANGLYSFGQLTLIEAV